MTAIRVAWYANDGLGNFGTQQTIATTANSVRSVCAADLDGDGDNDVLAAARGHSRIYRYVNLTPPLPLVLGVGCAGLQLTGSAMQINTDWSLELCHVSSISPNGLIFFGESAFVPGIPLSPGCNVYTTATLGYYIVPTVNGVCNFTLTIPNFPILLGFELAVQGTAGSPDPAAWDGVAVSNGLLGTIGL